MSEQRSQVSLAQRWREGTIGAPSLVALIVVLIVVVGPVRAWAVAVGSRSSLRADQHDRADGALEYVH